MGSCNITQEVINKIDGTLATDNKLQIADCRKQNASNFKSYEPYYQTGDKQFVIIGGETRTQVGNQKSTTGIKRIDGDCCYIINNAPPSTDISQCSDFSFITQNNVAQTLTELDNSKFEILKGNATPFLITDPSSIFDGSMVSICGIPSATGSAPSPATPDTTYSGLAPENANIAQEGKMEGGIKGLVLLVIAAILSMLVYILFVFGPFMFWTKFAPNMQIRGKNNCHNGRSILDRFFGYNEKYVPYNWQDYENCRPPRETSIVLDKCMGEDNLASFHEKLQINGSDKWSNVEYFIRGFPYNLIDPKKEKWFANYLGMPLFGGTILFCIGIFFIIKFFNPSNLPGRLLGSGLTGVGFGLILLGISIYYLKTIGKALWAVPAVIAFLITGGMFGSSELGDDNELPKIIVAAVISVIIFIAMSILSTRKTEDGKNYGFHMAFLKALYYIRRCFVTGYRESTKSNHWWINKGMRFIGKMTLIPNWFWAIFSPAIGIVIAIVMLFGWVGGTWSGFTGFYDFVGDKNLTQQNVSYSGGTNNPENSDTRGGGIRSRMKDFGKDVTSKVKDFGENMQKRGRSVGKSVTKTPVRAFRNTIAFLLFVIPIVFGLLYGILNMFFSNLIYHFMPLLYPNIMGNIISCNIKALIFKFGVGLLGTLWGFNSRGVEFVPYQALIWMTVTFCVVALYNAFVK